MLGLGADGRLVVAELKSSRSADTEVSAIKYAASVSRMLPETLADHFARFQSRRHTPISPDEALAELQAHAPDLSPGSLRRPRIVLLARDFSAVVTASVVWLSEMGLDIALVQISAFRSYVYGQQGASNVPMISVSQIYPVREVEDFTISPERQLAKETAEAKRRVQDAALVRRLIATESVADGTIFTLSPRTDLSFDMRGQLEEWLDRDPARRTAHWQNNLNAPLIWDVDKAAYTPAGLVRHIIEQATGVTGNYAGTQWWRDPTGWNMAELAGPLGGGKGAMYREYWSRWLDRVRVRHPQWTQMTTLPALNFITLPSPVPGTHYGLSFVAGGRLRSDFYVDLGTPEASAAQFDVLQLQQELVESLLRRTALVGAPARPLGVPRGRLQRGRHHPGRRVRLLHRLDDRRPGADAASHQRSPADRRATRRRGVRPALTPFLGGGQRRPGSHVVFSFHTASGANTTTSPAVHKSEGTR